MTQEEYTALAQPQREAMIRLQRDSGIQWEEFLAKCHGPTNMMPWVGVQGLHGMYVGIEPDGYTHT